MEGDMQKECSSKKHSQYFYSASAYGLAGEFERPIRHSIPTQAATVLAASGGRGSHRVRDFRFDGVVSFADAYVEVGGSFDACHGIHTTYAYSVVEGLNFADVLTADRIVSRIAVYSPADCDAKAKSDAGAKGEINAQAEGDGKGGADAVKDESSFDITGSHFENLKIAGHKIDVKLSTHEFHKLDTYTSLEGVFKRGQGSHLLPWGHLEEGQAEELEELENTYHALNGVGRLAKQWQDRRNNSVGGNHIYWCSPVGHLSLEKDPRIGETELKNFGSIICIPKFGVIRLAQMYVSKHCRSLIMFSVEMCSAGSGTGNGGGTTGGGGGTPLPPP
jgi:hypothetical protein